MSNILITGGTGSLGSALARKWYGDGHTITILSRDPHKQSRLTTELPKATFILADICNASEVCRACEGQDILIHAAALKDVSTGEYHPSEFARVNVLGTQVVAEAWRNAQFMADLRTARLFLSYRRALFLSSDKSCQALNAYGASKKIGESLFRKYNYSVIRYGNVVTSNGSFIHAWRKAIAGGRPLKVRQPEPTRFFLTIPDAIALIEDVLNVIDIHGNGIFVPHGLKAFSIWEVAQATGQPIEYDSLLPYEKQHEILLAEGEGAEQVSGLLSRVVPKWNDDFLYFKSKLAPMMTGAEVLEAVRWSSL